MPVCKSRGEGDEAVAAKHRCHHRDVEQVPGVQPRIVSDEDIPGPQRFGREFAEQRFDGYWHGETKHRHRARRMREALAAGLEQVAGESCASEMVSENAELGLALDADAEIEKVCRGSA